MRRRSAEEWASALPAPTAAAPGCVRRYPARRDPLPARLCLRPKLHEGALEERFTGSGIPFLRTDLTPGPDGFEHSTPLTMLGEAERLVALHRPRVLMGSSLGGYLSAVLASRGAPVDRIVLLAPAFRLF